MVNYNLKIILETNTKARLHAKRTLAFKTITKAEETNFSVIISHFVVP